MTLLVPVPVLDPTILKLLRLLRIQLLYWNLGVLLRLRVRRSLARLARLARLVKVARTMLPVLDPVPLPVLVRMTFLVLVPVPVLVLDPRMALQPKPQLMI